MKKLLLPLCAMLLCMTACQKEENGILTLEVEYYNSDTKVHLDNNYAVWDNNDTVWVNGTDYTVSVDNTTHTASLCGIPQSSTGYKAIYPASWVNDGASASADYIGITYPEEQTYRTNSEGKQVINAPMAAYSDGSTLKFHNIGSILAVTVTNSNSEAMSVQKIEVSAPGIINGAFTVRDITTAPRLQISFGGGHCTTTLKCNGVSIAAGATKTFYIAMPSSYTNATADCSFSPQLTIKVYDQYFTYTKTQGSAHTMEANHGYTAPMSTTDSPDQYAPKSNQLLYTASSQLDLSYSYNLTSAYTVSTHSFSNGKGIITFTTDITNIPEKAFFTATALNSITLPSGVISIEEYAFYGCTNLTSIDMSSVSSIGEQAFFNCSSLTSVNIPLVTIINSGTFEGCSNLTSLYIPSVTSIEGRAFFNCSNLTSIDLPQVTSIGSAAFRNCTALATVNLYKDLTSLSSTSFGSCSISILNWYISSTPTVVRYNTFGTAVDSTVLHVLSVSIVDDWNTWRRTKFTGGVVADL